MSRLVAKVMKFIRVFPKLSNAIKFIGRKIIRGYWRVRELIEPIGIWIKVKIFWQARLKYHQFLEVAAQLIRDIPNKIQMFKWKLECILSFFGFHSALGSDVDSNLVVMMGVVDLRHDPRIEREARALTAAGWKVVILCPTLGNNIEKEVDWGLGVTIQLVSIRGSRFTFNWPGFIGDELFAALLEHRPFAYHAHDLNMAFIAFAAARRTGAKVVVDFHEWYSENVTYDAAKQQYAPHAWPQRAAYRWLERHSLREADAVVTVCDSIADAMAIELGNGRRPEVVRNIPSLAAVPTRAYKPLKEELGLAEDRFVLLYQGGLGPSRLIEPIVEALAYAPACTLVIRGPQIERWGPAYAAIAARIGAADRLVLTAAVPSRDVVAAARGADAGIYTVLGVGRNFVLALPNKVFEYMAAGLPLLVADYPEVSRLVGRYDVGLTFQPDDPRSIAEAINVLVTDRERRSRMARNTHTALAEMDAASEWQRVAAIYQRLRPVAATQEAA
jgi:glycosyltransferase involved in cell wall biosynthesis